MSDSEDAFNTVDETFSDESDMNMAIRNIYEACDEHNIGWVPVSKLVEFITPYMEHNMTGLQKLKGLLDPNDSDPEVAKDVFYDVMTRWAKKFNQEESFHNSIHNISPRHLANPPLVESTPRKSFGNRQLRVYAEAEALNMSVVEKTSFLGTADSNESIMEKSILEEQIKQLAHQSKKFNDELLLARSQLNSQEEQNLVLQNEIDKLVKDLKHEREINDALLKENKTFEEMRENSFNKQKKMDKLKKDLLHLEKENQQLQNQNSNLEHERQKTDEKMVRIHEKLAKSRKEVIELRAEINMKDEQLNFAEEVKSELLGKMRDLNDLNDNLKEANNCLRVEKEKVSKLLQDNIKLQSQAVLNFTAQKQPNFASPPSMFVVERTENRRPPQHFDSVRLEESGNEEDLVQAAFSSAMTSAHASLMDELAELREGGSPTAASMLGSDRSCANCNANLEVKRRLDDLCDQIEWLRTENTTLRQSESQFVHLMQSRQNLEDVNKQRERTIEEMNRTLAIARDTEEGLLKKCSELSENVKGLEKARQDLDEKMEEIVLLKRDLHILENEKERLLKGSSVDQSMIERLKDDIKSLENSNKCLELKIMNAHAEREKLVEEHKNHIDEYSKQIRQYQEDISQLEKKFYSSHDQVTSLLAQNEESATTNAKLFLQHQKLLDVHNELQTEHNYYVKTINDTSPNEMPTRQKLQLLLKAKEHCARLETRLEHHVEEKEKAAADFRSKIVELEKKCWQALNARDTPRKTPHDRAQIKLEKLREKLDHLEDVLRKEKVNQASLQEEVQHLQRCNDALIKEKIVILNETEESQRNLVKQTTACGDLARIVRDIIGGILKARYNVLKLSRNWKAVFEQVDSVQVLLRHLGETVMEDGTNMDAFATALDVPQISAREVGQAQNDLQSIALILDALASCNIQRCLGDVNGVAMDDEMTGIKVLHQLSRPMSPDSPNLGAFDALASISGAGDNTLKFASKASEDSEGCEADVDSEDDEFDGFDLFEDLHKMYQSDNLDFLRNRLEEPYDSTKDLKTFVDEFVLTFMVDCTGFKHRLQEQFEALQEVVTRLVEHLQTFATLGTQLKRRKHSMLGIVRCLFELTKSAERYGAIQREVQSSRTVYRLISYITSLRELVDSKMAAGGNLHGETVYVGGIHSTPGSSDQLCEGPQNRIMSLLHTMRPANVVRLVGAVAVAFILYYFSQRFVSLLAASDGRGGGGGRRHTVCWASWLDLLASCLGRLRENGPPPV